MGQSRRTQDDITVFVLLCKLVMQAMAATFLTYPAVLLYLLTNDPVLLSQHDEVWVGSCTAPLWGLWAILRHKRVPLRARWVVFRSVMLLVLSTVVASLMLTPAELGVVVVNPIHSLPVLGLLWLWIITWRMIDWRWLAGPRRGEIWSGLVPFEEGSYDEGERNAKDRPCLVISTVARHAYVLKITSAERRDRIEMPAGWHPWSDKTSWLQPRPLIKVSFRDFRQHIRTCPEWLWARINTMYPPGATPVPATQRVAPQQPASRGARPRSGSGPAPGSSGQRRRQGQKLPIRGPGGRGHTSNA